MPIDDRIVAGRSAAVQYADCRICRQSACSGASSTAYRSRPDQPTTEVAIRRSLAEDLYIAMAGPHQIWRMPLTETEIGVYAGNGREDIVDGRLLPQTFETPAVSSKMPTKL